MNQKKKLLKVPWEPWKCPYIDILGLCSLFFLIQVILKGNIKLIYHVNFIFIPKLFILVCSVVCILDFGCEGWFRRMSYLWFSFLKPFINYSAFLIRLSQKNCFPFKLNDLFWTTYSIISRLQIISLLIPFFQYSCACKFLKIWYYCSLANN